MIVFEKNREIKSVDHQRDKKIIEMHNYDIHANFI
jgi:hypothetical protein